jgi:hypothetical protein
MQGVASGVCGGEICVIRRWGLVGGNQAWTAPQPHPSGEWSVGAKKRIVPGAQGRFEMDGMRVRPGGVREAEGEIGLANCVCTGGGGRVRQTHLPECRFEDGSLSEYFDELHNSFRALFHCILFQQRLSNMNSLLKILRDVILDPP